MKYFTICDFNYLHLGLTLAKSVLRCNNEDQFDIILCDKLNLLTNEVLDIISNTIDSNNRFRIIVDEEIIDDRLKIDFYKKYNIIEYCTAIKPFCFSYLFSTSDDDAIVYLDPDIYVYEDFSEFILASKGNIFLTPHTLYRSNSSKEVDELREFRFMQVGVFNLGFLGLKRSTETSRFIKWWEVHLENHCKIDYTRGLFVDQKWMDMVPCLFEGVVILKHAGLNVAYWNLKKRDIQNINLYFFHFSATSNLNNVVEVAHLLDRYRNEIAAEQSKIKAYFPDHYTAYEKLKLSFLAHKQRSEKLARREKWFSQKVAKVFKTITHS